MPRPNINQTCQTKHHLPCTPASRVHVLATCPCRCGRCRPERERYKAGWAAGDRKRLSPRWRAAAHASWRSRAACRPRSPRAQRTAAAAATDSPNLPFGSQQKPRAGVGFGLTRSVRWGSQREGGCSRRGRSLRFGERPGIVDSRSSSSQGTTRS